MQRTHLMLALKLSQEHWKAMTRLLLSVSVHLPLLKRAHAQASIPAQKKLLTFPPAKLLNLNRVQNLPLR